MPKPNLLEKARKANLTSLAAMTPLLVSCRRPVGGGEGGKPDFWCSYTYQKTTVTNQKNNPARRDSKVVKSKGAFRRIFVSPLLLDTLALAAVPMWPQRTSARDADVFKRCAGIMGNENTRVYAH